MDIINQDSKGYSRSQDTPPATSSTPSPKPVLTAKLHFSKEYLLSIRGLLRILLIIVLFGGWVAACAAQNDASQFDVLSDFKTTRLAYIIIGVSAFGVSIILLIMYLFNIVNVKPFTLINFYFITLFLDGIFFFPMLALGITSTIRETQLRQKGYYGAINKNAFAAAAAFAFMAAVIYAIGAAIEVIYTLRKQSSQRVTR